MFPKLVVNDARHHEYAMTQLLEAMHQLYAPLEEATVKFGGD